MKKLYFNIITFSVNKDFQKFSSDDPFALETFFPCTKNFFVKIFQNRQTLFLVREDEIPEKKSA